MQLVLALARPYSFTQTERAAYDSDFRHDALTPTTRVMFEDDPRNLIAPHTWDAHGATSQKEQSAAPQYSFYYRDLSAFLRKMKN